MSRKLGNEIPADFREKLGSDDLSMLEGRAILLLSVDEAGLPHPAMLSYREMSSPEARTIRFALWKGSTTAKNMRRDPLLTIVAVDEEMSYYLKGRVSVLREDAETFKGCSLYEFQTEEVLEDKEPHIPITGGIEYRHPEGPEPVESRRVHLAELNG
ncbi:MAG: hypothetical protein ACE5JS_01870 [Nitrospinota bacterium]